MEKKRLMPAITSLYIMREPASTLASAKMVRYLPKMPTTIAAEANSPKRRIIEQIFDALPMVETNAVI